MREGHGVYAQRVTFDSSGELLVGDMYLPGPLGGARRPAVVVAGAWATVKEQRPPDTPAS